MLERLKAMEERYNQLNNELMQQETLTNIQRTTEISKEMSELEEAVQTYRHYRQVIEDLETAKEMQKDPELAEMAHEEVESLTQEKEALDQKIELLLVPKDPNDGKNIIAEIRGAAGGDEANIFAGDLYRMYQKYAEKQGWKTEVLDATEGEAGGFSQIQFMIPS